MYHRRGKKRNKTKKRYKFLCQQIGNAQKNWDQNKTISVPGCCSSLSFPSSTLLLFPSFIFKGGKKKLFFDSSIRQTQEKRQDHHFYFILNLPPFLSFQPTPQVKKKRSSHLFFLSPSFAAQLLPPPSFIKTNGPTDRTDSRSSGGRRREESE